MPLELGLFLGAKAFGSLSQQTKRCIVLDEHPYRYQKYCSDIAGQDIRAHGAKPHIAIEIVRNWLSTTDAARGTVIPSDRKTLQVVSCGATPVVREAAVESAQADVR